MKIYRILFILLIVLMLSLLILPAPAPALAQVEPPPGCDDVHVVQPGETLFEICNGNSTCVDIVKAHNCIYDEDYIYAGQKLCIADTTESYFLDGGGSRAGVLYRGLNTSTSLSIETNGIEVRVAGCGFTPNSVIRVYISSELGNHYCQDFDNQVNGDFRICGPISSPIIWNDPGHHDPGAVVNAYGWFDYTFQIPVWTEPPNEGMPMLDWKPRQFVMVRDTTGYEAWGFFCRVSSCDPYFYYNTFAPCSCGGTPENPVTDY